jgi:pterin-4a-carbinolamine dehydratase
VQIVLYTHAAGGLTMFDFIVAAKIDAVPVEVLAQKLSHE